MLNLTNIFKIPETDLQYLSTGNKPEEKKNISKYIINQVIKKYIEVKTFDNKQYQHRQN